ncbi:MAG: ATP-dependent Clp protease ATP-binding subunit ClpA, partial [Pseudomonadota bacterium]
ISKAAIGFERSDRSGEDQEEIERLFTPEFRNRLDSIIGFAHLTPDIVSLIVDKFVMQLETQLADRNVIIELTDEARKWLAREGYDQQFGARPLSRVIQENIKKPLASELLFGKLSKGGPVRVKVVEDKIDFDYPDPKDTGGSPPKRRRGGSAKKKVPELVE